MQYCTLSGLPFMWHCDPDHKVKLFYRKHEWLWKARQTVNLTVYLIGLAEAFNKFSSPNYINYNENANSVFTCRGKLDNELPVSSLKPISCWKRKEAWHDILFFPNVRILYTKGVLPIHVLSVLQIKTFTYCSPIRSNDLLFSDSTYSKSPAYTVNSFRRFPCRLESV
jgi:hypothetical protein